MTEPLRQHLQRRMISLESERSSWIGRWQELGDFILPDGGPKNGSSGNEPPRKPMQIIDATGSLAARTLASGMSAGLSSPKAPWFKLAVEGAEDASPVRVWLQEVERMMRAVFRQSNVYNVLPAFYKKLAVFGTAAVVVQEDREDIIRCYPLTLGEYSLANSDRLQVDTLYRSFKMTVSQTVQRFGIENVTDRVKTAYDNGNYDQWVDVSCAIEPNTDRRPELKDARNKPYRSVYWEKGASEDKFLSISGYDEFPVMAARWDTEGTGVYGCGSPGMEALGSIKALQQMHRTQGKALAKMVDPPLLAPSHLRGQAVSMLPGGITYVDGPAADGVRPLYQMSFNPEAMINPIQDTRREIERFFYADLFLMLAQREGQMTAREVQERHEEKLLVLGPVLERLQSELLAPLITRTFAIMARSNLLPPPPEEMGGPITIDYISPLAQAQEAMGVTAIERAVGFTGNLAGISPDVIDNLDMDTIVDEYGRMLGVPAKVMRDKQQVAEIRQARQKAQQQQEQMAMMQQGIEGAKLLSETETGEGQNALQNILGV